MRRVLTFLAMLSLAVPTAAAVSPPGVNIRWDNCYDDGGTANKLFACDTNAGTERLVLSFVLDAPMADVSGTENVIDLAAAAATWPAWWAFKNAGSCRQTSLTSPLGAPPGSVNCADWSNGQAAGGIGGYGVGQFSPPNTARLVAAVAVPFAGLTALDPDVEYLSMSFQINHLKTVGTGSCGGCDVPMCIVYQRVNLTTPVAANNRKLTSGANLQDSQIATWQHAHTTGVAVACGQTGCSTVFSCAAFDPTSARNSTWGAVKSLYR